MMMHILSMSSRSLYAHLGHVYVIFAILSLVIWSPIAHARKVVMLITQRGCEEVCKSFRSNLEEQGDVEFIMRDTANDLKRLPDFVAEAKKKRPDLIATWGTSITLGVVGPHDKVDSQRHITHIPVVYMYVGNPVESKIAVHASHSGRPNVAGAHTAVPIETQLAVMQSYRPVRRVGMVYNANEPAAVSQANAARQVFQAANVDVVSVQLNTLPNGEPDPQDIGPALTRMNTAGRVDFLYYVGSTFTLAHIQTLSQTAIEYGVPMFSSLEPAYRRGTVLVGLISPLAGIGQIAAYQAGRILFQNKNPESLPTPTLSRHSVLINMEAAHRLRLYPPMKLLQFAEVQAAASTTKPAP
jgi:putative ABC transport system substrate-binding protein